MPNFIKKVDELDTLAERFIAEFPDISTYLFVGDLGAGKTTFIKTFAKRLGVSVDVNSPTFSIINEYPIDNADRKVFHIDLYRLKSEKEAIDLGIEEYLYSDHYCIIEWPQVIEGLLPMPLVVTKIEIEDDFSRRFEVERVD